RGMALEHLSCDAAAIHRLFTPEAMEATRHFLRQAKAFAPAITDADLFQALRNVWVMHSVQLLLGAEIALTPAVFAYSMLYPWTDNVLDNVQVGHEAKIELGDWLALRLAGQAAPPPNAHCAQISALIGMIERQYPRPEFPGVYFSLQAIHTAQMRSLAQQNAAAADDEHWLLRLSIAKGGASVLADAWLTRGSLTHEEAEFMFAYGVVLQLMDDLQDLADDLKHRHNTLFSRQAGLGALDALTGRLWAFTQRALRVPCGSASAPSDSVRLMIGENLRLMLLQGVARHRECYTPSFLRSVEAASPVSFAYLARQEASLRERYSKALRSVQRKRKLASAFELLD
ncbi:MAG TPA: hypothetical protein VMU04_02195, partial [Candidatus Acidoferrum sp.]|nr:hypothetical protein [Candidatus Acidoferrum sp.]